MLFYLLLFFIILVCLISIFVKSNEQFTDDFDKILDFKCRSMNSTLNNYLGPWDEGSKGLCSQYSCPTETCSFLIKDTTISPKYGNNNYTWTTDTFEKVMTNNTNNDVVCSTRHNELHPVHNTTLDCQNIHVNDQNHNRVEECHTFDNINSKWDKNTYIKLLDSSGVYSWHDTANIGNAFLKKTEQEVMACQKEGIDCSVSNYYCCKLPGSTNSCYSRPIQFGDQYIQYEPDPSTNGLTCIPSDTCGEDSCRAEIHNDRMSSRRNCWKFNVNDRSWENDVFYKKLVDGKCDFFNNDDILFSQHFVTEGICKETEPEFTNEKCARDNTNITCSFLDDNENHYTKVYQPRVDYSGNKCVYETEVGDDVLFKNGSVYSIPAVLNDNDVCPPLSPENCKDPHTTFLKVFQDGITTSRCSECPEGSYRNNDMITTIESLACSPNAVCTELNECNDALCERCLTNVETSEHGDKYEIVYVETEPDKDQCDPKNDSHCEKNTDGSYVRCPAQRVVSMNNGKRFCDNCSRGYALKFSEGDLQCEQLIDCQNVPNTYCYNNITDFFDMYKYENETDKFSRCVWKPVLEDGPNIDECITQCPMNTYRTTDDNTRQDFCTTAQRNINNNA